MIGSWYWREAILDRGRQRAQSLLSNPINLATSMQPPQVCQALSLLLLLRYCYYYLCYVMLCYVLTCLIEMDILNQAIITIKFIVNLVSLLLLFLLLFLSFQCYYYKNCIYLYVRYVNSFYHIYCFCYRFAICASFFWLFWSNSKYF